jgi:hypothetical protein
MVHPAAWRLIPRSAQSHDGSHLPRPSESFLATGDEIEITQHKVVSAVNKRHQTRRDARSLSQNLFDSVTMIYSYSKQLPTASSILDALRSPPCPTIATPIPSSSANGSSQTESPTISRVDGSAVFANDERVTPHANGRRDNTREYLQSDEQDNSNGHSATNGHADGHQVHKIPFDLRTSTSAKKTVKLNSHTLLDGTVQSPMSLKMTKKLSLALRGAPIPTLVQAKEPSVRLQDVTSTRQTIAQPRPVLVESKLDCASLERLKNEVYHHRKEQSPDFYNLNVDYDSNRHFRPTKPFVNRSLFYALSDPDTLLKSFHEDNLAFQASPLSHLDSARLAHSFRDWDRRNGALIFDSLWTAVEALFRAPPELDVQKSPRLRPSLKGASTDSSTGMSPRNETDASGGRYLSNLEAAHIVMICIHALTSLVSVGWPHTWAQLRNLRSWGIIIPHAAPNTDEFTHPYLNIVDELEYEPAIRLADRLLRGIGARTCFEHILASLRKQDEGQGHRRHLSSDVAVMDLIMQHLGVVEHVALTSKRTMTTNSNPSEDPGWTVTATFMEWLKTIIMKKWDNKVEINKWSSVGTAIMLIDKFRKQSPPSTVYTS